MVDFAKVTTYFFNDHIEGDRFILTHGTKIHVQWPDGTETRERLVVRRGHEVTHYDMFAPEITVPAHRFVVVKQINGMSVDIPLRGLMVARG